MNGEGSFTEAVQGAWHELRGLLREHFVLGVLEAQRAGLHLAYVLAAVLVVSVLVVTAWLAIVTAIVAWLASANVSWPIVFIVAAVLNLIAAALVAWWAKRQVSELPFSATLRQLSADRHDITMNPSHAQASRS
ncbi:MAG TPA: phage holin family protein [Burkholderiales bacterium]|nr:phage holin family protein [Burkholderiales bacterium]